MEGYIKVKQNNLAYIDKQAFIHAVVKRSQKCGLGISHERKQLRWCHPVYLLWWQVYQHLPPQVWLLYHTCLLECTHTHKYTLSASTCTQWQTNLTNCHPILSMGYRDSTGPAADIIEFPLPRTSHSKQTPASGLPDTQNSSFNTREDGKQTGGLQTRSWDSHWIPSMEFNTSQNESPQCSMSWALKRTNSVPALS